MKSIYKGVVSATITACLFSGICYAEVIPFDSNRWTYSTTTGKALDDNLASANRIESYLGEDQALFLQLTNAVVNDISMTDGTIEYDVAFSDPWADGDTTANGFYGVLWRADDVLQNYEHLYFRAQRTREIKAIQYEGVSNGGSNAILYGQQHTETYVFPFDTWLHVKLLVAGNQAELYVYERDAATTDTKNEERKVNPLKTFYLKGNNTSGAVGLVSGGKQDNAQLFHGGYYANFDFTPGTPTLTKPLPSEETPIKPLDNLTDSTSITSWMLSGTFDSTALDNKRTLTEDDLSRTDWTSAQTDGGGVLDIYKFQSVPRGTTAYLRTTLISDKTQVKRLNIRYYMQNEIKVYFNGDLIFSSSPLNTNKPEELGAEVPWENTRTSLDYRSDFRHIYLPLKSGNNELWIAGATGVIAQVENMDGISFSTN
ncbi:MAG: hypothetical protein D3921_12755 [Candidatus Electrothrix sp. AW1]|nr:hypothetical protein [Candidatus Electrothrix gigas]